MASFIKRPRAQPSGGRAAASWVENVEVESHLCIKGGLADTWVHVQTMEHLGRSCVEVNGRSQWLAQAAFGATRVRDEREGNAVDEVIADLSGRGSQPATGGALAQRKLGVGGSDAPSPKRTPRKRKADSGDAPDPALAWVTAAVGEATVEIGKGRRGRQIFVVADPAAIRAIVYAVRKKYEENSDTRRRKRAEAMGKKATVVNVDDPLGRITWNFREASWQIQYQGPDREVHTTRKGLRPESRESGTGDCMEAARYEAARAEKYAAAQAQWNALDQSGAERFVIDSGAALADL